MKLIRKTSLTRWRRTARINQLAELKANAKLVALSMTASTDPNYKAVKVATLVYSDGKNGFIVYFQWKLGFYDVKALTLLTAAAAKAHGLVPAQVRVELALNNF